MDDIVKQAMAKWPNVPDCYGWLGLDARGNWYMRDDAAQAAGAFASGLPGARGSLLQHAKLIEFIQRNYACNDQGEWFFQNGPQRVYVELQATPWIWRVDAAAGITSHAGGAATYQAALMDEHGWLYLQTSVGFGLVHTQDVAHAALAIEAGHWSVKDVVLLELPQCFGYVTSPQKSRLVSASRNT
jgi:Protein of unknown function (DUF2946)